MAILARESDSEIRGFKESATAVARNVAILDTINADLVYKDELVLDDIVVMQAALVHAQFETIHPFPDGNGRVGRAMIHALLQRRGLTDAGILRKKVIGVGGLLGYFADDVFMLVDDAERQLAFHLRPAEQFQPFAINKQ